MNDRAATAVVPMRHNSERVPGKNYRPLAGIPLYHHVVNALSEVPEIVEIIIDTDSEFIIEDAAQFAKVRTLVRPEHLRDGGIPMNEVLANTLRHAQTDVILQTHSTNPFVTSATFARALEWYFESGQHDSVFSVTRLQARLWAKDASPVNHDPAVLLRTQDLDPLFLENSCFYIFPRQQIFETGNRIGSRPGMYEVQTLEALDIDEERDFEMAAAIAESGFLVR